ncbi:Possible DNA topoisomerase (medium subunit) [Campylobacter phage CP220]|uniref:Possible DNA topoisomerase (Medium subunit) n=1 Tax=Campylobacter phage CP220 TaxID=2994044 RepID=D5GVE3_9CAUD|nr:Possible DNA topoisomerase (medium subunit) [Campylobacter phage CP220]CBJ93960.1 Possible DNA topoisomerase (medium subunit) [Campylobacter phage CP220]
MVHKSIQDYFLNELTNYSCYSTLRMIASSIDGLKNSSRKIINTALDKKLNTETKVSIFDNMVQSYTQYLHGSCAGVIQNMAASYTGSNNIPLLEGKGNFGSRFINEPAAPRYVYVKNKKYINDLFDIKDVLISQNFEGSEIEPVFYVPSLPILVLNGSMNGLASGFKQNILPRSLDSVIKYIKTGKKVDLKPYIAGFKGTVELVEDASSNNTQWNFIGVVEVNKNKAIITEIPPFIEYTKYLEILDNLVESKKIKNYKDLSDQRNQEFKFEVIFFDNISKDKAIDILKLSKRETEIYNALDENNQVRTFENIESIIDYYIDVRKRFLIKQKDFDLKVLENDLNINVQKLRFVKLIIDSELQIMKRSKKDIELDLESKGFIKFEDSYDYLLKLPIHSFTNETFEKLVQNAKEIKAKFETLKNLDTFKNYVESLDSIKNILTKA